jgi:hypothetical protein
MLGRMAGLAGIAPARTICCLLRLNPICFLTLVAAALFSVAVLLITSMFVLKKFIRPQYQVINTNKMFYNACLS